MDGATQRVVLHMIYDELVANPCDARENSKNEIFIKCPKYFFLINKNSKAIV